MAATNEAETAPGKQNGETFNDEMKDYAKSTMNELLGMFGYEEAITREAVEELQIRLLPEEDDANSGALDKPMETDKDTPVVVNLKAGEAPVVMQIAGGENGGNPSVLPVPIVNNDTGSAAMPQVIPVSTAAQPLSETPSIPSGSSGGVKPGTALAPHFLAEPPNIKGVYCVVASLPVVNSSGKANMTFKFWNCIMCSEYFVQKPEVVFRVEHPHLFGSHPDWLYQAAVCQKCHQSLKASKQGTSTASASAAKEATSVSHTVETADGNQLDGASVTTQLLITSSSSNASDANFETSDVVVSSSAVEVPLQSTTAGDNNDCRNPPEVWFDCYVCSKQVRKNSRQGKLRRSKFPTLFSNLPESVGITRVCFTCCERLTRQRDRFVSAGISEENRDYAAHIKIWTGHDIGSKLSSPASKNSDCSTCFVCEKYMTEKEEVKTLNRSKFLSLFSAVPSQIIKLLICDACNRKLLKVKSRFDGNKTEEEERDYWVYINSWRDQKGLEKHMYSN